MMPLKVKINIVYKRKGDIKMPHPEMKQIISLLEKGKDFSLDQYQYRKMTGIDIPKSKYYTEKRSAVAKRIWIYINGYTRKISVFKIMNVNFEMNKNR